MMPWQRFLALVLRLQRHQACELLTVIDGVTAGASVVLAGDKSGQFRRIHAELEALAHGTARPIRQMIVRPDHA